MKACPPDRARARYGVKTNVENPGVDRSFNNKAGNRKYVRCIYVYNKIDILSMEEVDELARRPYSTVISCYQDLGMDFLLRDMWSAMALTRVYTKVAPSSLFPFGFSLYSIFFLLARTH